MDSFPKPRSITGVSGCGKNFLLEQSRLSGVVPDSLPVVSFGERLAQRLRQELAAPGEGKSRDVLKTLSPEAISQHVGALIDEVVGCQPAILNSHTVYLQGSGLAINPASELRLCPSHYIFVSACPEDIVSWRSSDISRRRPEETAQQVELHQAIALGVVGAIAEVMDSRFLVVHNTSCYTDINAHKIGDFLASL